MIEVKTVAYIRCWGDVPIATKLLQLMSKAIRWALGANVGVSKRRARSMRAVLKEQRCLAAKQWAIAHNAQRIWAAVFTI